MSSEKEWFNQQIFYYKDTIFNPASNNSIEIALSISSNDLKIFSSCSLMVNISNQSTRWFQTLNIQNSMDLVDSFKMNKSNIENEAYSKNQSIDISKNYSIDKKLRFLFKKSSMNNDNAVAFSIIHSENNYGLIIIPYNIFLSIMSIISNFINNYISITIDLSNRSILSQILQSSNELSMNICKIPQMKSNSKEMFQTDQVTAFDGLQQTFIVKDEIPDTSVLKSEFDNFIEEKINTVEIDGIEDLKRNENLNIEKKVIENKEHNSFLFNDILENDFLNIKRFILSISNSCNPTQQLISKFSESCKISNPKFLPDIKESDFKSVCYLSKVSFEIISQNSLRNGIPITASLPIIRYNLENSYPEQINLDLMYDIFLLFSISRSVRSKLEDRISSSEQNFSDVYLALRCFMDVFSYSFADKIEFSILKSSVLKKFEKYNENGFFNSVNKLLETYNCGKVQYQDVESFLNELETKGPKNIAFIDKNHKVFYEKGSVKLSYNNNFNLEQIIKEIIPIEVYQKVTKINLETEDQIYSIPGISSKLSKEVFDLFLTKNQIIEKIDKPTTQSKKIEKKEEENNLIRYVVSFIDEIPESHRESFVKYLRLNNDQDFDFLKYDEIDYSLLGENILKGLYMWKPSQTPQITYSYKTFYSLVEECYMSKDMIIASLKINNQQNDESSDDWANMDI